VKIIDKLIIAEFLKSLFFITAGFLSILYIVDFFNHLSFLSEPVGKIFIIQYYFYKLPFFLYVTLPFSILFSTTIVYGRLNDTKQLSVLFNTGLSIYRIAAPAFVIVIGLSIIFFLLGNSFVSKGITASKFIKNAIINHSDSRGIYAGKGGYILSAAVLDISSKTAYMPVLYKKNGNRLLEIKADKAILGKDLKLYGVTVKTYTENGFIKRYKKVMTLNLHLSISDILLHSSTFSTLSINELWKLRKIGNPRYRFMMLDRLFSLLMPITMFALAISIIAKPFRREENSIKSAGIGIVYATGYFIFHAVLAALGKSSMISPIIGATAAHITFLLFAILKIEKE